VRRLQTSNMLQSQHVFSHQHQYPQAEPSWLHQQQNHHQQQHNHQAVQQHAQAQAAAAAAAAAQQQHYNRIAASNNSNGPGVGPDHNSGGGPIEGAISEENRRVLGWVAELMNGNLREAALMELSKKREQVPELALIIWHSFGRPCVGIKRGEVTGLTSGYIRRYDFIVARDNLCLPTPQPVTAHSGGIEPSLQRTSLTSVCCVAQRNPRALSQW